MATGKLEPILKRDDIESEQLKQAAANLRLAGDAASARRLLEVLYTRELDGNNLDPSNFLGLAEVRLESNDAAGALALLRRMTLVAGEPFETLTLAAELLGRFNRKTEALEFWEARAKAAPWDHDTAIQLAIAKSDAGALRRLAANNQARYVVARSSRQERSRLQAGRLGFWRTRYPRVRKFCQRRAALLLPRSSKSRSADKRSRYSSSLIARRNCASIPYRLIPSSSYSVRTIEQINSIMRSLSSAKVFPSRIGRLESKSIERWRLPTANSAN